MPITVPAATSTKVALWATILTGAYAVTSVLGAITARSMVDGLKAQLEDPQNASPAAGQSAVSYLGLALEIASYVLLALWMSKLRAARTARGETIGGPPAVEWWGWFVPLANLVLPVLGMRALTKARAGMGLLVGWWIGFAAAGVVSAGTGLAVFGAIDWSTGKLAHAEALDPIVGIMWTNAIALVVSWVFLAMIIRVTTRRQAEAE